MKVSLNLAQYYSNVDIKKVGTDKLIAKIGAQLGAIEEVTYFGPRYDKIVVAKVVACAKHPNADKLHVVTIDDRGTTPAVKRDAKGHVQVVCGAPNVREGITVAWLPPGSTVPSSIGHEPFVLEARELRGVVSNGMLASAKELGINDDHDGILEITDVDKALMKPGTPFGELYDISDVIIDCENKMFTHRPDCFGNLGVARELAGISGLKFKSPDWYLDEPKFAAKSDVKLIVKNDAGKLVPRLTAVAMSNVAVQKSPVWLQALLARVGIKSINNVVDITNFVMHLTGQPLHAYDADKLGSVLTARMAKKGEQVALLNGKALTLDEQDLVIATDKKVVGLAGIMGGSETEVDDTTKNIVIECATFDMYTIRRSSMRHGLFTDASTRYTKGQSPLQNARALWYAMKNMQELANARQASSVYDVHAKLSEPTDVLVSADFINERLGSKLQLKDIATLLENVEFSIKNVPADKNRLHIKPPFWRTDIELPEDIVEEVGRLHGFDQLPIVLPARPAKPTERNKNFDFKQSLRASLSAAGANEVLTYSFVHGDLMRKTGTDPDKWAYHIRNAISPDLQYYRTTLMPSLLDKVRGNLRADLVGGDDKEFALFEIGTAHVKDHLDAEKLPAEMERLALVFAADSKTAGRKYSQQSAFYQVKHYLQPFAPYQLEFEPLKSNDYPVTSCYQVGRAAVIKFDGKVVGVIGEFNQNIQKALKLPDFCAGFELDLTVLAQIQPPQQYQIVSTFPKIQADMTFETAGHTSFSALYTKLQTHFEAAGKADGYIAAVLPWDIFQAENSDKKRLTFRVWLSHPNKTLKTAEVNTLLDAVAAELKQSLGADRI